MGRPALLATTRQFLDDLGLASLDQLPRLEEAGAEALMSAHLADEASLELDLQPEDSITAEAESEPTEDKPNE